jgi:hypothetical protein
MAFQFVITPGYVFTPSEAVTYAKLNKMLSLAYANVLSGTLDTAQIGDLQVTAAKLASTLDLSGKAITLPTNLRPKTGITATTTVPDFIGQWGVTAGGIWYVATGTSAGNWKSMNCLLMETQWNADATNFPEKTTPANNDWLLIEDSAASYAKKKAKVSNFVGWGARKYKYGARMEVNSTAKTASISIAEIAVTNLAGYTKIIYGLDGGSYGVGALLDFSATGALGLDTGSFIGNRWYSIYAIAKDDGTSSVIASLSGIPIGVTLPSGYTYLRRFAEVYSVSGSSLLGLSMRNNTFSFYTPLLVVNTTFTTSYVNVVLPYGVINYNGMRFHGTAGSTAVGTQTRQLICADATSGVSAPYVRVDCPATSAHTAAGDYPYNSVNFDLDLVGQYIWYRSGSTASETGQQIFVRGYTYEY